MASAMPPAKPKRPIFPVLFLFGVAAWAFWGAWRVWESLLATVPQLAAWHAELTSKLPDASVAYKAAFFVLFLAAYLLWAGLPGWILLIFSIVQQERSVGRGLGRALAEVAGALTGTIVLLGFWFGGTLFLAFFGDLIDLVGSAIVLVAIAVIVAIEFLGRRSRAA